MKFMGPELGKTWGKWGKYYAALHHCVLFKKKSTLATTKEIVQV